MPIADPRTYCNDIVKQMLEHWPKNRLVNIVCHGHSVPAGYFATPMVDALAAYPHQLFALLKERFPYAVINVIVTAIGGENSTTGAQRFERDVLCHQPSVVTIDYALNDRGLGLQAAEANWRAMIEQAQARNVKVILLTPTHDISGLTDPNAQRWQQLVQHAQQVRRLAEEYGVGLVDSFAAFEEHVRAGGDVTDLLSWSNHPNRRGHALVAERLLRWFAIV